MSDDDWDGYFVTHQWGDRHNTDGERLVPADPCPECHLLVLDELYAEHEAWHHSQHKVAGALAESIQAIARSVQLAFRHRRYGGSDER